MSIDLGFPAGGLVKQAAERAGFSERDVLVSASHTHGGPSMFSNYETYNTIAPAPETIGDPNSFVNFLAPRPPDPKIYSFLVRQIARAIERAKRDAGPAVAGWGSGRLLGVTENRSIEAHLANHGISEDRGNGRVAQDPRGYPHTIDPAVNVLRVDKLIGGRRVPVGGWSTFADHGTVNPSTFEVYSQDHHGAATREFERGVRREGDVPGGQEVLNVYGNSDAGDQSAALEHRGPAHAERVGGQEADAMLDAWRGAGDDLSPRPELDLRWTRVCFCGQHRALLGALPAEADARPAQVERGPPAEVASCAAPCPEHHLRLLAADALGVCGSLAAEAGGLVARVAVSINIHHLLAPGHVSRSADPALEGARRCPEVVLVVDLELRRRDGAVVREGRPAADRHPPTRTILSTRRTFTAGSIVCR